VATGGAASSGSKAVAAARPARSNTTARSPLLQKRGLGGDRRQTLKTNHPKS